MDTKVYLFLCRMEVRQWLLLTLIRTRTQSLFVFWRGKFSKLMSWGVVCVKSSKLEWNFKSRGNYSQNLKLQVQGLFLSKLETLRYFGESVILSGLFWYRVQSFWRTIKTGNLIGFITFSKFSHKLLSEASHIPDLTKSPTHSSFIGFQQTKHLRVCNRKF